MDCQLLFVCQNPSPPPLVQVLDARASCPPAIMKTAAPAAARIIRRLSCHDRRDTSFTRFDDMTHPVLPRFAHVPRCSARASRPQLTCSCRLETNWFDFEPCRGYISPNPTLAA